jgi:hypothetical protein
VKKFYQIQVTRPYAYTSSYIYETFEEAERIMQLCQKPYETEGGKVFSSVSWEDPKVVEITLHFIDLAGLDAANKKEVS